MIGLEQWRPIQGYEGFYEVSDKGRVRSVDRIVPFTRNGKSFERIKKGVVLRAEKNGGNGGYLVVVLCKDGKPKAFNLHKLVAFAFPEICGEWFEGATVNHKDWDTENASADNLEWVTWEENLRKRKPVPVKTVFSKLTPIVVEDIVSGDKHYFLHRYECVSFLEMSDTSLIYYYIKRGIPYRKRFLISYLEETDSKFSDLKVMN